MVGAMNTSPTKAERAHMARVRDLDCSVCNAPGPSIAHHIDQKCAWTTVALCPGCHDQPNGIHGKKIMWNIYKMNEIDALGVTIMRLMK